MSDSPSLHLQVCVSTRPLLVDTRIHPVHSFNRITCLIAGLKRTQSTVYTCQVSTNVDGSEQNAPSHQFRTYATHCKHLILEESQARRTFAPAGLCLLPKSDEPSTRTKSDKKAS